VAKINKKLYKAFIVPHTHWDRERYQTFQQFQFRIRLVNLINNLIGILEKDKEEIAQNLYPTFFIPPIIFPILKLKEVDLITFKAFSSFNFPEVFNI